MIEGGRKREETSPGYRDIEDRVKPRREASVCRLESMRETFSSVPTPSTRG